MSKRSDDVHIGAYAEDKSSNERGEFDVAAPTCILTVIKRFPYRGDSNEEWSNTYMLTGATPVDSTAWRTLFDLLVAEEKKLYKSGVQVIGGYGYDSVPTPGDSAVWSVDLTVTPNTPVAGALSGSIGNPGSGDTAMWIRWGLDRLNTKGKRVYLRKYFHPALSLTAGTDTDLVEPAWKTIAAAFATKLDEGSFTGGRKITDRLGTITVGHAVGNYTTTRTLKRRGKRPGS